MRRYINKLVLAVIAIAVYSCSEDTMDDINKNVNNPTNVASQYVITDVMTSTAFSALGTDLSFYSSIYMEHNVGIYGQMYDAEIRTSCISSSTYDNAWSSIYNNLYNLKVIIDKCSPGGSEAGNYYTLGIAQALTAYDLALVTDLFGDVPWSEALQPGIIFKPKLDTQEAIYKDIFAHLDSAIVNLEKTSLFPYLGTQDLIYGGDAASIAKWKAFAYGLKARYTMRLSYRNPNYNDVIEFANKSFTSSANECKFVYNGITSVSPFYIFYKDRNYFGSSLSLHDKLIARNDPRDGVLFAPAPGTESIVFAPNESPSVKQGFYGISAISTITAPTYLLSYHEIEFLKAEAYARNNDLVNAASSLKKAVVAACAKVNIGISNAEASAYFDSEVAPLLTTKNSAIAEILVQKYIAFYEEEAVEAYNDYRRTKAMGENSIDLDNTLKFPLRFTYGSSDVTTNSNVNEAYGDGTYVYTENVWWAGGTR